MLLGELLRKFPIPQAAPADQPTKPEEDKSSANKAASTEQAPTIKQEPIDSNTNDSMSSQIQIKQEILSGPPEKKPKLN
jgi:hypothetical protein